MTTVVHRPLLSGEENEKTECHPFMTIPLELRLLIWEVFGSQQRVFEYSEDTGLVRPPREYRHPRRVGLAVCSESRKAIQALLKPFQDPHDLEKRGALTEPLQYIPSDDVFYLPPPIYRSRIQAWDSLWTTKPGIRNVGVHWSVLCDERRIVEALKTLRRCFVHMERLLVFVEFKALPEPQGDACAGGIVRVLGPVEDEYRLPSLFSEAYGLTDEFWTWGEERLAIERARRGIVGAVDVEGVLFCREAEDGPDF